MIRKKKVNKIHLRKSSIFKIASRLGWKGSGMQEDPYTIENRENFPVDLTFTATKNHIRLQNQQIVRLTLAHCQNIVIDNCTINQLHIEGCTSISIKNCRLLRVKHFLSKGNTFENNVILQESYNKLVNNWYGKLFFAVMLTVTLFAIFFMISSVIGFALLINAWTSLIYFSSGILVLSLSFYYIQTWIRVNKAEPNKFLNFKTVPYTEFNIQIAELGNLKH